MDKVSGLLAKIDQLEKGEKEKFFLELKKRYPDSFLSKNAFVVGDNFDFWNNEEDDIYDKL